MLDYVYDSAIERRMNRRKTPKHTHTISKAIPFASDVRANEEQREGTNSMGEN